MAYKKKTVKKVAEPVTDQTPYQPNGIDPIPEPTQPSKTSKAINYAVVVALVLIALALGVMFRWASASSTVLEVKNAPFPVRTIREHPTASGVVILSVDICKNSGTVGKVRTSFVSQSREIFLPVNDEKLPKGCLKQEIPVLIPKDIPPDTYKVKFRVTYDLNPLKKGIINEFESKEFTVDPVTASPTPAQ